MKNILKQVLEASLLDKALLSNATFSLISGISFFMASEQIATIISNVIPALYLEMLGILLVGFAAQVAMTISFSKDNPLWAKIVTQLDLAWVVLSVMGLFLFADLFTLVGKVVVIDIAMIVASFAFFQHKGLSNLQQTQSAKLKL